MAPYNGFESWEAFHEHLREEWARRAVEDIVRQLHNPNGKPNEPCTDPACQFCTAGARS